MGKSLFAACAALAAVGAVRAGVDSLDTNLTVLVCLEKAQVRPLDLAKAKALGDSMVNNQDDNGRIRTYWIPETGDEDPLAGAVRLPQGGDWFNCMAADVEALTELVAATTYRSKRE